MKRCYAIDDACRQQQQQPQESSSPPPINGIFTSIRQLHTWAASNLSTFENYWSSPQQLTKYAIMHANVLVVTYPFLLDPMTAMIIGSAVLDGPQQQSNNAENNTNKTNDESNTKMEIEETDKGAKDETKPSSPTSSDVVIVFDHAHNIDVACMDSLSAIVNLLNLEHATRSLDKLSSEIARFKQHQQSHCASEMSGINSVDGNGNSHSSSNISRNRNNLPLPLKNEYERLVSHPIDSGMYRPILFPSDDVVNEPVPGNIRKQGQHVGCNG